MRITKRQNELMTLIVAGDGAGGWLDIDQLYGSLSGGCTKQALQCSIRFLEKRNLILRSYITRRGRKRMVIAPVASPLLSSGAVTPP